MGWGDGATPQATRRDLEAASAEIFGRFHPSPDRFAWFSRATWVSNVVDLDPRDQILGVFVIHSARLGHQIDRDFIANPHHDVFRDFSWPEFLCGAFGQFRQHPDDKFFILRRGFHQKIDIFRCAIEAVDVHGHAAHHDVSGSLLVQFPTE